MTAETGLSAVIVLRQGGIRPMELRSALVTAEGGSELEADLIDCRLCNRPFPRRQLTEHHCRPRQKGGTRADVELLCAQCHGMVHATFTNATLAALYPTLGRLR